MGTERTKRQIGDGFRRRRGFILLQADLENDLLQDFVSHGVVFVVHDDTEVSFDARLDYTLPPSKPQLTNSYAGRRLHTSHSDLYNASSSAHHSTLVKKSSFRR